MRAYHKAGIEASIEKNRRIQAERRREALYDAEYGQPLTKRQQEIQELILDFCSTEEIAVSLCIATRTVDYHINKLYVKLGIHNRRQLLKLHYHSRKGEHSNPQEAER